jgi:hypothetical protein
MPKRFFTHAEFERKIVEYFDFLLLSGYTISESVIEDYGCHWCRLTGKMRITIGVDRDQSVYIFFRRLNNGTQDSEKYMGLYSLINMLSHGKTNMLKNLKLEENQDYALKVYSREIRKYLDKIVEIFTGTNFDSYYLEYERVSKASLQQYLRDFKKIYFWKNLSRTLSFHRYKVSISRLWASKYNRIYFTILGIFLFCF